MLLILCQSLKEKIRIYNCQVTGGNKGDSINSICPRYDRRRGKIQEQITYMMDKKSKRRLAMIVVHVNVLCLSAKRKRLLDLHLDVVYKRHTYKARKSRIRWGNTNQEKAGRLVLTLEKIDFKGKTLLWAESFSISWRVTCFLSPELYLNLCFHLCWEQGWWADIVLSLPYKVARKPHGEKNFSWHFLTFSFAESGRVLLKDISSRRFLWEASLLFMATSLVFLAEI